MNNGEEGKVGRKKAMADILDGGGCAAELARGLKAEALIATYSHSPIIVYDRQASLGAFCPEAHLPVELSEQGWF